MRWDGILRKAYGVALRELPMDEAYDLIAEIGKVQKWLKGEDPDAIDPATWFMQNTTGPAKKLDE